MPAAQKIYTHRKVMKKILKNNGSVLLVVVFAVALLSAVTIGILQMHTEEIQLMQNQVCAAQAIAVAEAGLNDAFAQIRASSSWTPDAGYTDKSFPGYGTYTVTYEGSLPDPNIISEGTSSLGYVARVKADITVGSSSPYVIRIDNLRINE
jgi:Tfp pilus assembly protein PilX